MEDWELLQDYAARNSEAAFRALVERHVGLVRSAALRQVRDPETADEVTQAVFILLARKAGGLGRNVALPGWLYRTTRFVATRAVRAELRRQRREQEAFDMNQLSLAEDVWRRVGPELDDAMERLGEKERNAVLLRFFQEQSLLQVGNTLGISEEAAKKRVGRGLEKLRGFFARRGFTLSAAVLGTALAAHGAQAAPAGMSVVIASGAVMHGAAAATSPSLPMLVQKTLSAWRWAKIKLAAGVATGGVAACLLVHYASSGMPAKTGLVATANVGQTKVATTPDAAGKIQSKVETGSPTNSAQLIFRAVDAATGKGITGAKVYLVTGKDWGGIVERDDLVTDVNGICNVPLPYADPQLLSVGAVAEGYVVRSFVWGGPTKEPMPTEYELKLERGARIGGVVQDEAGHAVAGADIEVSFFGTGDASWREFQKERPGLIAEKFVAAVTDAAGKWSFGSATKTNGGFWFTVKHPGFSATAFQLDGDEHNYIGPNRIKMQDLVEGKAVLTLKSGFKITGVVMDAHQNPIAGAKVATGRFVPSGEPSTVTWADGAFALGGLAAGQNFLTVTAENLAPERIAIDVSKETAPVRIELKPGGLLRLKIVDETGAAMAHARVALEQWRGENNTLEWNGFTDKEGRIEWAAAPREPMTFFAHKEGFFFSRGNQAVADGDEHVIGLHRQIIVSGQVIDADTKQPIVAFKVMPGSDASDPRFFERDNTVPGTNGGYQLTLMEYHSPLFVRVEADGFEPETSKAFLINSNFTYNVELRRQNPADSVSGVVVQPDGTPAIGAQVGLCTLETGVSLSPAGKFINREESVVVESDGEGRFLFTPQPDALTVAAINSEGFGRVQLTGTNRSVQVQLQAWGRVEGSLHLTGESVAGREVIIYDDSVANYHGAVSLDYGSFSTKTDEQGNFVFEKAPPGDFDLFYVEGIGIPFSHRTTVNILPGKTVRVEIGGTGATISGRFVASNVTQSIDWPKQVAFANLGVKQLQFVQPSQLSGKELEKWKAQYWQSAEGRARIHGARSYPPKVQSDGSFTIESVPPGTYQLFVQVKDISEGKTRYFTVNNQEVVVPDADGGQAGGTLDLGTVTLH